MVYEKQCLQCGQKHISKNNNSKFCSKNCTARYYGSLSKKHRVCKRCGETFWTPDASKKRSRYCLECAEKNASDRAVARERKHVVYEKECIICKRVFETTSKRKQICGKDSCRKGFACIKSREYSVAKHDTKWVSCKQCGKKILIDYGNKRRSYCSERCEKRHKQNLNKLTDNHKERLKKNKNEREKLLKMQFVDNVQLDTLFKRDGGVCKICGMRVYEDIEKSNKWAGTIDHIVPLIKGGEHSYKNCQLAHRICNSIKCADASGSYTIDWDEMAAREDKHWQNVLNEYMLTQGRSTI